MQFIDRITPIISAVVRNFGVRIATYIALTLSRLFVTGLIDRDKVLDRNNVVYRLQCQLEQQTTQHRVKYDVVEILANEVNQNWGLFLELFYIQMQEESLNNRRDRDNVSSTQ